MDILRELSAEELEYIICRFKENLPKTLKNLYYIYSAQKCFKEMQKYNWIFSDRALSKFYTHRNGLKENCTIFGITGERDHTVWYFSFDDTLNEIRECLEHTKLIRWGSEFLFVTLLTKQIQPVFDYAAKKNHNILSNEENSYYFLSLEDASNLIIDIPSDVYMAQLEEKDAALCNSLWKYKNDQSELWIKTMIVVHGGYGLRDKNTKELLSFGLINDHLAIGVLTTIGKVQRKGYGEIVTKYLAKKIAEMGFIPHVYVDKENARGNGLFNKLGFKKIGDSNWILMG